MTARRRSGSESGRHAPRRTPRQARPTLADSVRSVHDAVALARLVGHLNTGERRALEALIATLARLLDEAVPD